MPTLRLKEEGASVIHLVEEEVAVVEVAVEEVEEVVEQFPYSVKEEEAEVETIIDAIAVKFLYLLRRHSDYYETLPSF